MTCVVFGCLYRCVTFIIRTAPEFLLLLVSSTFSSLPPKTKHISPIFQCQQSLQRLVKHPYREYASPAVSR
jgi:hypothetical protein